MCVHVCLCVYTFVGALRVCVRVCVHTYVQECIAGCTCVSCLAPCSVPCWVGMSIAEGRPPRGRPSVVCMGWVLSSVTMSEGAPSLHVL